MYLNYVISVTGCNAACKKVSDYGLEGRIRKPFCQSPEVCKLGRESLEKHVILTELEKTIGKRRNNKKRVQRVM